MSEGPSGSPFPPPELDQVLSQAEAEPTGAPAQARRRISRNGFLGALLLLTLVLAGTTATVALHGNGDSTGGRAAIASERLAHVSVSTQRLAGARPSPVWLSIGITVVSRGSAGLRLQGGATFLGGEETRSVQLHEGANHVRLPLSPGTRRGRYQLRIAVDTLTGRRVAVVRSFRA